MKLTEKAGESHKVMKQWKKIVTTWIMFKIISYSGHLAGNVRYSGSVDPLPNHM